ncbi:GNAT family N-acetyltransferase [Leptospira harrisiae]|uniref:GNAT family N-acetyltransferase n=1 Tax=Leptospira harrisiae TaxID=2023189 RepID=A0A2N0ALX3_9LEPT|nr:GNAT family N-acetyltransferase [Leptospira harrisiae]PJZ85296.1 GNAT family N-acetyltransferase [Leptospira harrisiae]PKA08830.1 GNAT family N-acetyltransferase [Leptospira harrisiae]
MIRDLTESDRNQTIELVNQFYRKVNELELDGLFRIRPRAATKFTDIYFKLIGTGKVYMRGFFADSELVSLLIGRVEEKPHLEEERSLFIDLAVTKLGKKKKGYMSALLKDVDLWCKKKSIPAIELRAILQNEEAVKFWDKSPFERFYIRYRKRVD